MENIKTVTYKGRKIWKKQMKSYYLKRKIKTIGKHINNVLKPYGLTPEQYNVLRILKGSYPGMMCVKDISSRMIEKSSNVPRIIDRLEIKKLIRRNRGEDDGRQTMIELTKAGMAVLVEASKEMNQCDDQLIGFTETEAEQLNVILEKLRNS